MNNPSLAWSDDDLIASCRDGDQRAWNVLVEKYKNLVYSVPVKYHLSPEDAADVFQAVWMELYSELFNLRQPGALRGWLVTVATHKCYQLKRRLAANTELVESDQIDPTILFPEQKQQIERTQMLMDAINLLPERCQRMVRMLFFSDPPMSYSAVAGKLNLAEGSIGFIRGRCLKKLRSALEQMGF
jgi:RNA polymerase sigma factor (sigma-70 family)